MTPGMTASAMDFSPFAPDGILPDQWVGGENDASLDDGLTDEHPVEGVFMKPGQAGQPEHRFLGNRQRRDPIRAAAGRKKIIRWLGEDKFFCAMLDHDFPLGR